MMDQVNKKREKIPKQKKLEIIRGDYKSHKLIISWSTIKIRLMSNSSREEEDDIIEFFLDIAKEYSLISKTYKGTLDPNKDRILMKNNEDGDVRAYYF
jgi:hypothetical protein